MSADMERGKRAIEAGDFSKAIDAFESALASGQPGARFELGRARRRSGDTGGAREAFERAENEGDLRAICDLGSLLEDEYGDVESARSAYLRADAAGLAGGSYALGRLALADGDLDGAIRWNIRADELGHGEGAFSLGVALTKAGRDEEAAAAFGRADDRGIADGSVALGRAHALRGDFESAIEAFRRAEERGHPSGAALLGSALVNANRPHQALAAFQRAADAGDERVQPILEQLAAELGVPSAAGQPSTTVAPEGTLTAADVLQRQWINLVHGLESDFKRELARAQVARENAAAKKRELLELRTSGILEFQPGGVVRTALAILSEAGIERGKALVRHSEPVPATFTELRARWNALANQARAMAHSSAWDVKAWQGKSWWYRKNHSKPGPDPSLWPLLDSLEMLEQSIETLRAQALERTQEEAHQPFLEAERLAKANQMEFAHRVASADRSIGATSERLPAPGQPWTHHSWSGWEAHEVSRHLRLGEMHVELPASIGPVSAPVVIAFPPPSGIAIRADVEHREAAVALARSVAFRALAAMPPGQLRLTFVDPIAIGQSVADFQHMGDYDPLLVDTKPWVQERDIEVRMDALASHAETIIAKYLRGQYATIDEYNKVAGEVSEPYRFMIIFDYPAGFTERSSRQLLSLIENGPRCGIHTVLTYGSPEDAGNVVPVGRLTAGMQKVDWRGEYATVALPSPLDASPITTRPDASPPIEFGPSGEALTPFADLLLRYGDAARSVKAGPVTLDRVVPVLNRLMGQGRAERLPDFAPGASQLAVRDPATWWQAESSRSVVAPLGRTGAGDITGFYFSSTEIAGGGIMVGLPRSGKSTALHAAILMMSLLYSPEELELYLIDAKHGVEFKAYGGLPHARMVAINSEREFSLAILKSLDKEIARRAEVMKRDGAGHANITAYRRATGDKLPRIVLIMDEFHEIFEEDDRIGRAAFDAFSNIVRQGPFAGVHLVVASQTLSSMPAMDRSTLTLLPQRVAFMCNELDSDLVMGDENRATRHLTKPGEGIFNPMRGVVGENRPFQGMLITADERAELVTSLANRARDHGWTRTPRVFDGDALVRRPPHTPAGSSATPPVLALGEPYDLRPSFGPRLRRQRGGNLFIVGSGGEHGADGIEDPSAASALMWTLVEATRSGFAVAVVDFGGEGLPGEVADVQSLCDGLGATYTRGRGAAQTLGRTAAIVRERHAKSAYRDQALVLAFVGVHRAGMNLDLSHRPYGDDDDDPLSTDMAEILKNGPDVGVHTLITAPNWLAVQGFLGNDSLSEFSQRIAAGSLAPADMYALATGAEQSQATRSRQAVLIDSSIGACTAFRCYEPPSLADLRPEAGRI